MIPRLRSFTFPFHQLGKGALRSYRNGLVFASILVAWGTTTNAQDQDRWQCRAQLVERDGSVSPKPLFAVVVERYAATDLEYDVDFGLVSFAMTGILSQVELETFCSAKQTPLRGMQCIAASGVVLTVGIEPFPIRYDTGDPEADDARYHAAKNAWIDAHPRLYQQMLAQHDDAK